MKLLEYKARELFDKYGIPVMPASLVSDAGHVKARVDEENLSFPVVLKAQIPIGGRGKAGGIQFCENEQQAYEKAKTLLNSRIGGLVVRQLLVTQAADIEKECYLSIMLDRDGKSPILIFSSSGGIEIEETAKTDPGKITRMAIDPQLGVSLQDIHYILDKNCMDETLLHDLHQIAGRLYLLCTEYHCLLAEINPLAIVKNGGFVALDGKIDIDDSALYLLPDIQEYKALTDIDNHPLVVEAEKHGFLYIPVSDSGNVVVMSNGSGMLMNCIDMLSETGTPVSAAVDLGGGAAAERIREAVRILLKTPNTNAMFISVFGGLTRCDEVAKGLKAGLADSGLELDIVIRLEGTNRAQGVSILKEIPERLHLVDWPQEGVRILEMRGASR